MRTALFLFLLWSAPAAAQAPGDWPGYGRDPAGTRFSPLEVINRSNVASLRRAWSYRTAELGQGAADGADLTFEATPILFEGTLYLSTAFGKVVALDPGTGAERWTFDPRVDRGRSFSEVTSRGVAAWRDPDDARGAPCGARIYLGTIDARLIALDAATGTPCPGFGVDGQVSLAREVGMEASGDYQVTSPPVIVNGVVVVGSSIGDNWSVDTGDGIVRGFDARSGRMLWGWQPIPRDSTGFRAGAANAWGPMAADPGRDLVIVPTTSPSPDFFGGLRPGDNRWANSVVALRAASGELVWGFQAVHHDLWDLDLGTPPILVDLHRNGRTVPAVVQGTKMGFVFVLHRETGEPLFRVEERAVPGGAAPGEAASATQPFPTVPPPLVRTTPLRAEEAWGITDEDRAACRALLESVRNEGLFTPPSTQGTLLYPGNSGGMNWGGGAWEPARRTAVYLVHHRGTLVWLIPAAELAAARGAGGPFEYAGQRGAPFGMKRQTFLSPGGFPCTPPPWATLVGLDLDRGSVKWSVPFGLPPVEGLTGTGGFASGGGPIVTAGGLVFIAAARDHHFRAFDVADGRELWRVELPHAGVATPMTYLHEGRQFVVIAAGGHGKARLAPGDFVVAYALPRPGEEAPPPASLAGSWAGEFNIESLVVPARLRVTAEGATLQVDGIDLLEGSSVEIAGETLRFDAPFRLRDRGCTGTIRGQGRVWDPAMVVGQVTVSGQCSDGSPEFGSFTFRR